MNELENYYLKPGYIYAAHEAILINTVLGSCISVCIWDKKNKFGGMNHYVYPKTSPGKATGRYGTAAIPHLIRLMEDLGSDKNDLIAHVVGGSEHELLQSHIGKQNINIAEKLLAKEKIEIATKDVGGQGGRKVIFNTATGEILVYKTMKIRDEDWYK